MADRILPVLARAAGLRDETRLGKGLRPYALASIQAPTLLVSARDDGFGTYAPAEYTANRFAGAKFLGFNNGGHLLVGHDETVRIEHSAFRVRSQERCPPDKKARRENGISEVWSYRRGDRCLDLRPHATALSSLFRAAPRLGLGPGQSKSNVIGSTAVFCLPAHILSAMARNSPAARPTKFYGTSSLSESEKDAFRQRSKYHDFGLCWLPYRLAPGPLISSCTRRRPT